MAIKASATVTLSCYRDTESITRYYKLQSSTAAAPSKPTVKPPSSDWSDSEPGYTSGSTNTLYFCDLTVFSDGTWSYSTVSKSSSYEAAKEAYNKAQNAQNSVDGMVIGGRNLVLGTKKSATKDTGNINYGWTSDIVDILNQNRRFTVSVDLDCENVTAGSQKRIGIECACTFDDGTKGWFMGVWKTDITDVGTFKGRISRVVKVDTGKTVVSIDRLNAYPALVNGDKITISHIKVEVGNKATDWTPAPEDVDNRIDEVDGKVETVSNALDAFTDVIVGTQTQVTGSWTGVAKFSALHDGQRIAYWLPYNSSGNATLNLTLSGGTTTGAKNCYYSGSDRITNQYPAGNVIHLTYRENISFGGTSTTYTGWWADANYDSGNTYDRTRYSQAIKAGSAIVATNLIVGKDGVYSHLKTGNAFDVNYPILYASSAIAASATGTDNYLEIPFTVTTTQSITLTAYKPVYIKGKISGTTFTPVSTAPLTQTVPTTDDGYQYILLGTAYSTTAMYLLNEHPIFQYFDGAFKSVEQIAVEASKTATNFIDIDNTKGVMTIGNMKTETLGRNIKIDTDSVDICNGDTVLASYGDKYIYLGKNNTGSIIDLCNSMAFMRYHEDDYGRMIFDIHTEDQLKLDSISLSYNGYLDNESTFGSTSINSSPYFIRFNDEDQVYNRIPTGNIEMTAQYGLRSDYGTPMNKLKFRMDSWEGTMVLMASYHSDTSSYDPGIVINGPSNDIDISANKVYINDKQPLLNTLANGFNGLTHPNGTDQAWFRTTKSGLIPYSSSATGDSAIGTSSWPFAKGYFNVLSIANEAKGGVIKVKNSSGTELNLASMSSSNNMHFGYGTYSASTGHTNIYGNDIQLCVKQAGSTSYFPYFRKGHNTGTIKWYGAGYITSSSKNIHFTIPLSVPIIGRPTVTVTSVDGLQVRQGNKYLYGSSAEKFVKPSSYGADISGNGLAVLVIARMGNTTNVVSNNDSCGICASIKITFS